MWLALRMARVPALVRISSQRHSPEESLEFRVLERLAGRRARIVGRVQAELRALHAVLPDAIRPRADPALGEHVTLGIVELDSEDIPRAFAPDLVTHDQLVALQPPGHVAQGALVTRARYQAGRR